MERKLIAVAVASAMGLPMAAVAVEGSVSGHVNMAIVNVDDGGTTIQDANGSETRFQVHGQRGDRQRTDCRGLARGRCRWGNVRIWR